MGKEVEEYEVFLSFCGDVRENFTKHLYEALLKNGIKTFMDEDELERGEDIEEYLLKTIGDSKSAIVVFSEKYAFSSWCLKELAKIAECKQDKGLIVFPVFCDVDPSDIRKQKGSVETAFNNHKNNIKNANQVEQWRKALTQIANVSGWHLKDFRSEYPDAIRDIIRKVREKLHRKDIVGMDSRIRDFEPFLNLGSEEVHMVGIWGTGGIGKTTLVKEVFERFHGLYEANCFVYGVREQCAKELDGWIRLKKHVDENLSNKKASMKVLIVLDDIDNETQIEALVGKVGPGSKIIITTRDSELLEACGVKAIFEVKKLTYEEGLELFCRKAFGKNHPRRYFEGLSDEFVNYAQGLPLAIEVLGKFLYFYRSEEDWRGQLNRLRETPDEDINKILRFSYDALKRKEKETFLDIACFFNGEDESRVKKIFESCDFHPDINLKVLVARSLISITGGKVWMHDLLQRMGWEIICKEKELGKRSRLWRHKDALRVLQENMGTGVVEGIFLTSPGDEEIDTDPFVNMKSLRLLKICNVKFSESHDFYFSRELSLLEWDGYPGKSIMPSFQLERLVELIMPNSRLEQLWEKSRLLENLVVINLSHCQYLTETPDFDFVPNLETLILEGCKSLSKVHPSIGKLEHLVLLNMKGCEQLKVLPQSINLKSLTTFILSGCSNLKEFPEIVGDMKKLSQLFLDGTAIKELPTSINLLTGLTLLKLENCKNLLSLGSGILCNMTSLKFLNLGGCVSMDQLPGDLGRLETLEMFWADGAAIRTLPSSISLLKCLKVLSLPGCALVELPDELGCLSSLQYLDLRENNFSSIPESISQLSELKDLHLSKCSQLQSLPKQFPVNLTYVDARDCPKLANYSKTEMTIWTSTKGFHFIDCRNSSCVEKNSALGPPLPMPNDHVDLLFPKYIAGLVNAGTGFEIRFPCTTMPLWCTNWKTSSPIKIDLSTEDHEDMDDRTKGFAIFVVFVIKKHDTSDEAWELKNIVCHFDINKRRLDKTMKFANFKQFRVGSFGICSYVPLKWFEGQLNKSSRFFEASISTNSLDLELRMFGMHQVFEQDVEYFSDKLAQSGNDHLDLQLNFSRHCKEIIDEANKLERSGKITNVEDKLKQGENSFRVPQIEVESSHTAWDNIPTIEHKCYINETYKLLSELFQGYVARHNPFRFVLSFRILPPWFFHHSVGNMAVCYLPPNISNDERWLGLELYVHCGALEVGLRVNLYGHGKCTWLIYTRQYKTCKGNFIALHVPRKYFSKELNDCEGISAVFEPTTPDVEVEMCGTRLLYAQDSKLLSKRIIESIFLRPDLLLYLNKTVKGLLQKDESDGDWCNIALEQEMPESSSVTTHEPREIRDVLKSSQKLLTSTEQVAKDVSTLLDKYRKEFGDNRAVDEADSFVVHSKRSFFKTWDHIQQHSRSNLSAAFNHLHIIAETLLHKRDSQNQIEYLKFLLRELFEHRLLVTLSLKGHIIFVLGHFNPSSVYNLCFPQKGIPEWFDHQYSDSKLGIELPPNLSDDKSWRGLVMCAAFSVKEHPGAFSNASFRLLCHLESEEGCLNPVTQCSITKDKIKWVHLRGFIWLTYIPGFLLTELYGKQIVVARVYNCCPGLIVDKCGIRLLYKKDVEGLKKTITQCCTSFLEDLDQTDKFLESEDDEDLHSAKRTLL